MIRRRLLGAEKPVAVPEEWDAQWHYSQGLPEDSGFAVTYTKTPKVEMTDSGLKITAVIGSQVRYAMPLETCREGVLEVEVLHASLSYFQSTGLRLVLSDGSGGGQVMVNYGGVLLDTTIESGVFNYVITAPREQIRMNEPQSYRIERRAGTNFVYLDGVLQLQYDKRIGTYDAEANKVVVHASNNQFVLYLRSIKFKKIS